MTCCNCSLFGASRSGLRTGLLAFLVFAVLSTPASALEYRIGEYHVDIQVLEQGDFQVRERIEYQVLSGTMSRGNRSLPLERLNGISDVSVTADQTDLASVDVSRRGNEMRVEWSFPERDRDLHIEVRYRAQGALQAGGERNRVHWMALGGGWEVPISRLSASLQLPRHWISHAEQLAVTPDARVTESEQGWRLSWNFGNRDPGESQSLRVSFPKVLAVEPVNGSSAFSTGWLIAAVFLAGLLIIVLVGVAVWRHQKRLRKAMRSSPPKGLDVMLAVALLSEETQFRGGAHPGVILDLAQEGYLILEGRSGGFFKSPSLKIEAGEAATNELPPPERALVQLLAGRTLGSKQRHELRKWRKTHGDVIRERLLEAGLVKRDRVRQHRSIRVGVSAALIAAGCGLALFFGNLSGIVFPILLVLGLSAALVAAISLIAACHPYRLTEQGEQAKWATKGWLKYLSEAIRPHKNDLPTALETTHQWLSWVPMADPDGARLAALEKALKRHGKKRGGDLRDLTPPPGIRMHISKEDQGQYGNEVAASLALLRALRETQSAAAVVVASSGGAVAGGAAAGGGAAGGGGGGAS